MDQYLFLLKKFLGGLLMPLPIILLLLVWTLLFLLRKKTRWLGFLTLILATALLFGASYAPLSSRVTAPVEQQYPNYQPQEIPADLIAVLGSGHVDAPELPVTSELKADGVVRLAEGIRIYRLNPGSKLVFTGYAGGEEASYVEKIQTLALGLGVPEEDILVFDGPRDTAEEAQTYAENFADRRIVLVTSALHMPRAMALFAQAGLQPQPAPTHHLTRPVRSRWLFPKAETLARSEDWAHEQLGTLWLKLMGELKKVKKEN